MLHIVVEVQTLYCRYDAVTEEGELDWQNCLNEKNQFFFGDTDGLFTNYSWSVGHYTSWAFIKRFFMLERNHSFF